jgi:hypothetical protein
VKGSSKDLEEGSRAAQDLGVDVLEVLERGYVTDDPDLVAIQIHYLPGVFVGVAQIRLVIELAGIGDAWGQIRR